jgi:hypothetical protein
VVAVLLALLQSAPAPGWTVSPPRPTVGDTIWVARFVPTPAGWRVRANKLPALALVEPLGDAVVLRARSGGGWVVRYPIVAWAPSGITVAPSLVLLGPSGQSDSLPPDTVRFSVRSVIADNTTGDSRPEPQPALAPLRRAPGNPLPLAATVAGALGILAAGAAWRRRSPRRARPGPQVTQDPAVPDERWLAAGEPRAVAARAAGRLRLALARAVPAAHLALSTEECLAAVEASRPQAPLRDLGAVLRALDQVAFATAHGTPVAELAARARALTDEIAS